MNRYVATLALVAIATVANARRVEMVEFPSVERGWDAAVMLHGMLMMPQQAAPPGGFPAIVALHGCGGLYSLVKGHERELAERLALRADRYVAQGYVVLFPDSFGSRGTGEVCTVKAGARTIPVGTRKLDALGALAWLAARKDVARERIALVGWSHGGSTALQASNLGDKAVAQFAHRADAPPFFRAVVAFYPGCKVPLNNASRWQPGAPTRVQIGALDDWTPPAPCEEWVDAMRQRGADVKIDVYADAYHGFDGRIGKLVHRTDVPNGVHPGQGVHVGPNPAARELANARIDAFLRAQLAR